MATSGKNASHFFMWYSIHSLYNGYVALDEMKAAVVQYAGHCKLVVPQVHSVYFPVRIAHDCRA
jgi:hypothetical protein